VIRPKSFVVPRHATEQLDYPEGLVKLTVASSLLVGGQFPNGSQAKSIVDQSVDGKGEPPLFVTPQNIGLK
jgi:hypothetical protein